MKDIARIVNFFNSSVNLSEIMDYTEYISRRKPMMQRECRNGPFVIQCDECSETEELFGSTFEYALADARSRGYVVRKEDQTWTHYCRNCNRADIG